MAVETTRKDAQASNAGNANRDVVALSIAIAAIILFLGTGGAVMPQIVRAWNGQGEAPDVLLINALLLNIALLVLGWRRYKDLRAEIAERSEAEALARQLSEIDPLTLCLNRRSGGPAIDALCQSASNRQFEVAVLMVDLDNFKQINDLNGHKTGDKVLASMAKRIKTILPTGGVLARIGGDEFACAIPYDFYERENVSQFAAKLVKVVSAPVEEDGITVEVTVSVGIASTYEINEAGEDLKGETILHQADIAMYHAKKQGRNRHFWFEPQMENELRFRNELEAAIRMAIPNGEFVPYYEQQVDLETGALTGFEMLARWHSPRYGVVSPDIFIPIAEEMDLIADLSDSLIRQSLLDAKQWDASITLSVNISPIQMRDPWFAQKILHMLTECGFPPSRLDLEITESCLHENINAVRSIVTSLKNQGIRISLDDFGTGYSSLSQLRALPFDRLKIDRSFVAEMAREGGSDELVKAIIALGKGLSLPVTAEGVESAEVSDLLKGMGQLKGQGFLYGQPEDAAATNARLSAMKLLATPVALPADLAEDMPILKAS